MPGDIASHSLSSSGPSVRIFTPTIRCIWIGTVLLTVASEIIFLPLLPPVEHYTYKFVKALLFIAVGYLAPLSFWRFNALTKGIFLALISSVFVETLQGVIAKGHSFHWYELLLKLALILFGFSRALDARYERRIAAGPIQVRLIGEHLDS
jgi:hypothetical protein